MNSDECSVQEMGDERLVLEHGWELGMNWYVVRYVGPQPGVGDFVCTSENLKVLPSVYMCGSREMRSIGPNNDPYDFFASLTRVVLPVVTHPVSPVHESKMPKGRCRVRY